MADKTHLVNRYQTNKQTNKHRLYFFSSCSRLRILEDRGNEGIGKQMDTIAKLTGRVEFLESELKVAEERYATTVNQLETAAILNKDREKRIHQLQDEVWNLFLP